ncbi:MAG: radical SAM protein [Acidobacteriota bacterium]
MRQRIRALKEPIPRENQKILADRWNGLPPELQVPQQALGRHLPHCGFVLGPAYCSFGCTHCYLPRNANKAPLPTLEQMKAQVDANRRLLGHAGHLQITGGDVVDAYVRADRVEELLEIVSYACDAGLIPMLMTHGQRLLENPQILEDLVVRAGLRKVAIHIDVTQAGRPGFPRRELRDETDLHPLRQQFADLVLEVRRRTGQALTAAHTVTVTEDNLESVGEIVRWLIGDPSRLKAFSMLSLQPEADIGRTRSSKRPATPEATWREVCRALGRDGLAEDNLYFGDPACSRMTTVGVLGDGRILDALPGDPKSLALRGEIARVFGGAGGRGADLTDAVLRRIGIIARHPTAPISALRYVNQALRQSDLGWLDLIRAAAGGRLGWLNIVQHNFMSAEEVRRGGPEVERRLDACSFRGAVEREDGWHAVPMCSLNTDERESIYDRQIAKAAERSAAPKRAAAGG